MAKTMLRRVGTNAECHPTIIGTELVARDCIVARSGHSSSGSVNGSLARRDGDRVMQLDMGTRLEFFDPDIDAAAAKTDSAREECALLVKPKTSNGFSNFAREWWHFCVVAKPLKGRQFDFPIDAPASGTTRSKKEEGRRG